jgi:hypothetical protein
MFYCLQQVHVQSWYREALHASFSNGVCLQMLKPTATQYHILTILLLDPNFPSLESLEVALAQASNMQKPIIGTLLCYMFVCWFLACNIN